MRRPPRSEDPRTLAALLAITAGALFIRLWDLGWRIMHQDEARVADWIIRYIRSGHWEYSPIIHGPFLPHVNGLLFPAIGANDFTARLIVAVIGGVVPLAAWLFRTRLSDTEMVGLAAILAINPVLVYYSRFMRNDVLLAVFALVTIGFVVRAIDTDQPLYLHAAALSLALGFTTKENALLYPLAWAGALLLVLDYRLLLARTSPDGTRHRFANRWWIPASLGSGAGAALLETLTRTAGHLWRSRRHIGLALLEFVVVVILFYAPLPDLWELPTHPTRAPAVLEAATIENWRKFAGLWGSPGMREHSYLQFATYYLGILQRFALPLLALGTVGFLWARYVDSNRPLVDFATYWGLASIAGYPIVMDIQAAWATAHAIVPLTIPAAVGIGLLTDQFLALDRDAQIDAALVAVFASGGGLAANEVLGVFGAIGSGNIVLDQTALLSIGILVVIGIAVLGYRRADPERRPSPDQIVAGITVGVLIVAGVQAGTATYDTSFERPQDAENAMVQYAQPSGLMQGTLQRIYALSAANNGVDVLFYGDRDGQYCNQLVQPTEQWLPPDNPPCGWFSRLPLPWYFSTNNVTTGSATNASTVLENPTPVVIALSRDAYSVSGNTASDLEALQDRGYSRHEHQAYLWGRPFVFFVRNGTAT